MTNEKGRPGGTGRLRLVGRVVRSGGGPSTVRLDGAAEGAA
ncbi:hypothetical protein ACIPC2_01940 [Curtobacterium pusillum]